MRLKMALLLSATFLAAQLLTLPVFAEDTNDSYLCTDTESPEDPVITATYLISDRYIFASNSNGRLYVQGATESTVSADTIGIKDIVVERSSNGTSGWTQIAYPSDCLKTNTNKCEMEKWITVSHGYYYRITCNHYAYKSGWSPNSQTDPNTSNVVYIS
jgi:hypothetical protein